MSDALHTAANGEHGDTPAIGSIHPLCELPTSDQVEAVREVADALDRLHGVMFEIGLFTLLAEVRSAAPQRIAAVLDELSRAGASAIDALRDA